MYASATGSGCGLDVSYLPENEPRRLELRGHAIVPSRIRVNGPTSGVDDVVLFVDPAPVSFGGKLALRQSPDQKEISCTVPLNVKLRQGKSSKATSSTDKTVAEAMLPLGLLAKTQSTMLPGLTAGWFLFVFVSRQGKKGF